MIYKLKYSIKRLLRKENFYFIDSDDLEKFIREGGVLCNECGKEITEADEVNKVIMKKNEIIFYCKSCIEEVSQ